MWLGFRYYGIIYLEEYRLKSYERLQILFMDWGLSKAKIEKSVSIEYSLKIVNFKKQLGAQLRIKDDLSKAIIKQVKEGQVVTTEMLEQIVQKNLRKTADDILFCGYPGNLKQLVGLESICLKENFNLEIIWYFKLRNPNQFMKSQLASPIGKIWTAKYDDEVIEKWKTEYNQRLEQITEIQEDSNFKQWKIIEVDFNAEFALIK